LEGAFRRRRFEDHETEGDLVGSFDHDYDWATSLQAEEKHIEKEDQKIDTVSKVAKVDDAKKDEPKKEDVKAAEPKKDDKAADKKDKKS
jgi:hypothetical protein